MWESAIGTSNRNFNWSKTVEENEGSFWTIYGNKPKNITDSSIQNYPTESDLNFVMQIGGKIYYSSSPGLYSKQLYVGYHDISADAELSNNVLVQNSTEKDSQYLYLNGNTFIYNYLSSIEADVDIGGEIRHLQSNYSMFDSNNLEILSAVIGGYESSEGMIVITDVGRNSIFFTDGGSGFFYNTKTKEAKQIKFDQLDGVNGGSGMLQTVKRQNGRNYFAYGTTVGTFNGFGDIMFFGEPNREYAILANVFRSGTNRIKIVDENNDFLVGSNFGLKYVYNKMMTRSFYDKSQSATGLKKEITDIEEANSSADDICYIVAQGNALYEVTNLRNSTFHSVLELDKDETILDVFVLQKNEYIIATTKGIYTTDRRFELIDDLEIFTVSSVYRMINEELAKVIAEHIEKDHKESSFITKLNKKADVNLSFLSTADKHEDKFKYDVANGVRVIENDIIDTIEIGGEDSKSDSYVKVAVKNWATNNIETEAFYSEDGFVSKFIDPTSKKTFDISTVPYIVKNWKSGLKEIYVYVPTTATYYINNPQGMSNSLYSYNAIGRQNIPGVSNVNILESCCTTLRVYLYNSHFRINTILAAQCVGNSLPLKIYKDNVNASDSWKGFFDTVVQPSVLRTLPMTKDGSVNNVRVCTDETDRIYLDFSVYGTDAQAIRIIAET